MSGDTSMVDGPRDFPSTVWEDLHRAGDPDAFNQLAAAYWRPVYGYLRRWGSWPASLTTTPPSA